MLGSCTTVFFTLSSSQLDASRRSCWSFAVLAAVDSVIVVDDIIELKPHNM
jgi:hypothetical protein